MFRLPRYTFSPMALTLGGYQLVRRIAVGGMAEVFLALKTGPSGFAKQVAIKRILPHLASDPELVAMFLDEARLAARLDHPHIVHIHDLGVDAGNYYLAMEYVAGVDVAAMGRAGNERGARVPDACAAALLEQAASALEYAHQKGIIHRDVTPANLLVSWEGVLKLADFGIAKAEARATRTAAGALKGKIAYMSPEQAGGGDVDGRSDVYALGVCAWELLCGRRLHGAADDLETLARVRAGEAEPVAAVRPDAPPALAAIVERALERDPDRRWPTARAFGEALGAWLREHAPAGDPLAPWLREHFGEALAPAEPLLPLEPTAPSALQLSRKILAQLPGEIARLPLYVARAPLAMARLPLEFARRPFAGSGLKFPRARLLMPLLALLLSGVGLLLARSPSPPQTVPAPSAAPARMSRPVLRPRPPAMMGTGRRP